MRLELRRHPWHWGTSLLGKTSDRRDAQRPWSALLIATVAAASPTAARTARRRPEPERPSEGVLLVSLQGGGKTRMMGEVPPEADNGAQAAF